MPSGGNSVDIDSIMLNIDAESKGASDSIDALCGQLGQLKSALTGMQGKTQALRNIANALHVISKSRVNLAPITSQLQDFSKLNLKDTGLTQFVSNLQKLSTVTGQVDVKVFGDFAEEMKKLNDVSSSSTELLKAVNSFTRSSEKMKEAAANFPALSAQIQEFFATMSNVTVSDSTVRMAEALADIARNGVNANSEMKRFSQSSISSQKAIKILDITIESIKDGFKQLGKILMGVTTGIKNFAGKAVEGVKSLASKIKEMVSNKGGVETLHISLKSLFTTLIGFHSIRGLFSWTKDALEAGGALTEVNHIVESMYGDMSDSVKAWADTMIDRYGIASMQAKQYAGTLTAMSKAAGVATEQATEIGLKLTEAAGDISAFFNIDTADAYQKLQSGLAGQVRPLRSLGIDLTAATLKQFAFDEGIEKSYTDMTQAEKIMLRYNYIMKVLSSEYERGIGVLGDYERTMYSYENSLRKLTAYMEQIKTQIGAGFTAAIRPALVVLNELMAKLLKAAKAFTTFMQTLFPFENGASGMALADTSEYAEDLAEGTNDAADGLSLADTAAKKLKKDLSVLPFDELNQLNKDREQVSTSDKSVGGTDAIPSLDTGGLLDWDGFMDSLGDSKVPDAVDKWAERIRDAFERHDWAGLGTELATGINEGIQWLYEKLDPEEARQKIDPFVSAFTTALNSLIDGVNFYKLGGAIGEGMTIVFNTANSFMEQFDWPSLGRQLGNGANGLIDNINWESLGNLMANRLNVITGVVSGFANRFKWGKFGGYLAKGANAFVNKINKEQLANAVGGTLNGITETVKQFALQFGWENFGDSLAAQANLLVDKINFTKMGTTVSVGLNGIITATRRFLNNFKARNFGADLAGLFSNIIGKVKWAELGQTLAETWNKAWEFLKSFVKGLGADTSIEGLTTDALRGEKINANKLAKGILPSGGTGLGKAIHDALEGAISNVKTEDMIDTITTLVGKIADDIITVFGKDSMWYDLGHKFGEALGAIVGNPENAKKAASAVSAIARGISELISGAIDALEKHWPLIKRSLWEFITGIEWGEVLKAAAPFIGAAFALKISGFAFSRVKSALRRKIEAVFTEVGTADSVVSAGGSIFQSIIKAIGTSNSAVGSATLIGATLLAANELAKLIELMNGDNGVLTQEGGIIDSFATELETMGLATGKTQEKLHDLKEDWENGEITDEDFYVQAAQILKDGGVNADEAANAMGRLGGKMNITNEQASTMESIMSGLTSATDSVNDELSAMGATDKEEGINKIKKAIGDTFLNVQDIDSALPGLNTEAQATFAQMIRDGSSFNEALKWIIENYQLSTQETMALREAVDTHLGQPGIFDTLIGGITSAKTETEKLGTSMDTVATNTTTVGTNAGTATTKLGGLSSITSTAKNMFNNLNTSLKTAYERTQTEANKAGTASQKISTLASNVSTAATNTNTFNTNTGTANTKTGFWSTALGTAATKAKTLADKAKDAAEKIKTQGENADTAEGYVSNYNSTNEKTPSLFATVSKLLGTVLTTLLASYGKKKDFEDKLKEDVEGAEKGIKDNSYLVENAAETMGANARDKLNSETMLSNFNSAGQNLADEVGSGIGSPTTDSATLASDLMSGFIKHLKGLYEGGENSEMWILGHNIIQTFANGLSSVSVAVPHVEWDQTYTKMWTGEKSYVQIPNYVVNWYARGGLFTDASIVGVGEAGTETVLPLENKRTMGMIADAIVGNSGGLMDENALANAVASGYVRAMMANQGNQQQPIFNIVVKTENDEVLARAVTRGQQSIDYRNNPTPRYNY